MPELSGHAQTFQASRSCGLFLLSPNFFFGFCRFVANDRFNSYDKTTKFIYLESNFVPP